MLCVPEQRAKKVKSRILKHLFVNLLVRFATTCEPLCVHRPQEQLVEELSSLKAKVDSNAVKLSDVQKKQESFALKYEKLNGKLHENSCKIEEIEKDLKDNTSIIDSLYERLLATERYSRGYNLRFYKVPERQQEDCIENNNTPFAVYLRKIYIYLRQQLKLYGKYTFISTSMNFINANELSITLLAYVIIFNSING